MRVWISKYALTQGIFAVEAETCEKSGTPDMIQTRGKGFPAYYHGEGREWHRTNEGALYRAQQMRKAKVASLEKRIKKLNQLSFEANHD